MADFLAAYNPLKQFEGGWCNVPGDAGGETYAGIARNFFPDWSGWPLIDAEKSHVSFRQGSTAFSRRLSSVPGLADLVTDWYRVEWWERMRLGQFPQIVAGGEPGPGRLRALCATAVQRTQLAQGSTR